MKNILSKIPTFIYSLLVICTVFILTLTQIINQLDPLSNFSRILFSITLTVTSLFVVPTLKILFYIFEEDYPEDLRTRFRLFFSENIFFSIFLGILMIFKTYGFFSFKTLVGVLLAYILIAFLYKKLKKPRRIKRI